VLDAVRSSGIDPHSLTLEITESVLMHHTAATIDKMAQLRVHGIRLAIDDFGTGYSSLSYLDRFPVDTLKIDRSFVDGFGGGREGPVLVRAIIELGHALGLDVVAEGIEREDQVDPLSRLGCKLGQGYLFARPLDAEALDLLLATEPLADDSAIVTMPVRRVERTGSRARRATDPGKVPRIGGAGRGARRSQAGRAG
jgi:EAL domain-containing protein (putative c-di-GMP-specific phosphodiesterase class I)